jgi:hypothetical protein
VISVYIRKDNDETRFPELAVYMENGGTAKDAGFRLNTKTGATGTHSSPGAPAQYGVVDVDANWWRMWMIEPDNASGNTQISLALFPAVTAAANGINGGGVSTAMGSIVAWGANIIHADTLSAYEPDPFYEFGDASWDTLATLGTSASSYKDYVAPGGIWYDYRILAVNAAGSSPSNIDDATPDTAGAPGTMIQNRTIG